MFLFGSTSLISFTATHLLPQTPALGRAAVQGHDHPEDLAGCGVRSVGSVLSPGPARHISTGASLWPFKDHVTLAYSLSGTVEGPVPPSQTRRSSWAAVHSLKPPMAQVL